MAMKIDNDISSRVRNRITEVDKEKQAREAARAKTEPIPVNKVTTPVTPKKVTPLPQNVQNGFNIITSQIAQNTQNYQKYGTPINRNNIVPETPTRIVTAYDKNGNQVETKQPEIYYNPNKALLKKDETGKNVLEKTAEDKEFAEKHTTLGIGKDKKSYIPQALSAGTWSASNALINAPRVIGDVFETLNNKFVSPNLKTDNPDAFVKVPSQESIKAARSDYETIRNYYGQHAEEAQNTLMRMTANSQAQQQIANLVQSVPEMAAIAAVSYMSGGLAGATLGADLIGGTLATGAVVDNTISGMIGRIIKQYANNPTFWSSMATQAAHVSEDAKAAGADPFTALTATALIGPLNAAIETAGGIGSGEDDLLKILTKGQLAKATVNTALEEGLEEVKQGGVQELVFQALGINPVKPFTNELERKLGIPQRGINAYASTEAYDAANETPAVIDPSRMAQEFAGGALMGGAMSLPGHAVNYQVNKNGPQPIPVNVPGARYEATENGFGTNGRNPLAKDNLRTTTLPKNATKEEMIQEISDITEGMYPAEELQSKSKSELKEMLTEFRRINEKPDTISQAETQLENLKTGPQPIPVSKESTQPKKNTPKVNKPGQVNVDVLETDVKRAKERLDFLEYKIDETGSSLLELQAEYREDPTADMKSDPRWASLNKELSEQNKERERLLSEIETKESEISGYYESIDRMAPQPIPYNSPYEGYEPGQVLENGNRLIYKKGSTAQIQQNYDQTGNIREALQGVDNKQQNIPYNFDLNTKEGRMAAKVTDEKTENQLAALSKVFKRNIRFATDFDEGVHGKHDLSTGDIVLNANSIKNGESVTRIVLGHELTHGLEKTKAYAAMSKLIEKYVDSQDGVKFKDQVEKLRNSYKNEIKGMSEEDAYEYLKQEYIAEFAGNFIFNNEEFIARLCKEDRTTFERVKEWIQDTISKLTSNDDTYKMLIEARRLYDKAARQSIKQASVTLPTKRKSQGSGINAVTPEEDKLYERLANHASENESELRSLVDKAARANGYKRRMFHETNAENIHVFDLSQNKNGGNTDKNTPFGIYTKSSPNSIGVGKNQIGLYVKAENTLELINRSEVEKKIPGLTEVYDRIKEVDKEYGRLHEEAGDAVIDTIGQYQAEHPEKRFEFDESYPPYVEANKKLKALQEEWKNAYDNVAVQAKEYITSYLRKNEYDSMYLAFDEGSWGRRTDSLIVLDPEQVKSSELVTKDDSGKIIPLSERFNSESKDIRYSQGSGINAQTEEEANLYNKLNRSNGISFNQNTDNKGRTLSAGQKQYFQYAKTRDASGNLKTYYHGSPNEFDTFDIKKARSNGTYGKGFYFSESDSHAGQYGKQMEVYLNITNPVQNDTNAITKEQLRDFIQELADNEDDYGIDNYGYDATVDSVLDSVWGKTDFQMLLDLNASCVGNMVEAVKLFNEVNGTDYDGIIAPTETVAFYPEQIKQVTNQNPTTNPNTKLSKGAGIEAQSEEETNLYNKLKNGSDISLKGKALDNAYEKAVKDGNSDTAKMLVEQAAKNNGYDSPRLYHGSPKFGFTEFDLSAMDDGNSIFTTVNRRVAESYSGETSRSKISEGIKKDFWDMDTDEILSYVNDHIDSGYRKATVEEVNADIDRKMQPVREAVNKIDNFLAEKELTAEEEKIIKRIRNSCETFSNTTDNDEAFGLTSRVNDGLFDLMWENEDLKFELMDAMNYSEVSNAMTDLCQIIDTNAENNLFTKDGINLEWEAKLIQELDSKLKPGVYELYGDLDHMLEVDAKGANWNEISTDFDDYFNAIMPFAKTRDICNYARQKGYEGVIIKNVKDSGGAVQGAHVPDDVYVFFYPSKVKSADVETYDDNGKLIPLSERFNYKNKDLRYSKGNSLEANTSEEEKLYSKLAGEAETKKKFTGKEKVEAAKELVAVHNLQPSELLKSFELGGLPMPSIAILKANQGHSLYGSVSLIFDKNSIDPKKNKANNVYGADAYTPEFPRVYTKTNENKENALSDWAYDMQKKLPAFAQNAVNKLKYDLADNIDRAGGLDDFIEDFKNDVYMKEAYLIDTGRDPVQMQTKQVAQQATSDRHRAMYEYAIEDFGPDFWEEFNWVMPGEQLDKFFKDNGDHIVDVLKNAALDAGFMRSIVEKKPKLWWLDKFYEVEEYKNVGPKTAYKTENDYSTTQKMINEAVDQEDYERWLSNLLEGSVEKLGLWNGKESFLPSGKRRSWEQLHYELNLENVVKAMKNDTDQGAGFGGMNLFGSSAEKFSSLSDVKERQNQLYTIPQSEYEKMRDGFSDRFNEITSAMSVGGDWRAREDAGNVLLEALTKFKTKSAMDAYIKKQTEGWATYSDYMLEDFLQIVDEIRQMPTGYFEAKPKRAVSFGEAKAAIVPSDINPELVSKLEEYGTEVHMYEPGNEEQRRNILNSLDALKFRKAEGITADTEAEKQMYSNLERSSQITSRRFQRQQAIPYNRPTENAAPEEETVANVPETVATTPKNVAEVPETRRAQDYTRRSAKEFKENLLHDFKADRFANNASIKGYVDEIVEKLKTGTLTEADRDNMFYNILSSAEVMNQDTADMYSEVIKELKGRPLYVSQETSRNITDYPQFRRNSKLSLSSKGGSTISDVYYSIEERYPGIFRDETGRPIEPNTQEEMLEALDNLYNKAQSDMYTPLTNTEYILQDGAIEAYRADFDREIAALEREVNIAKRYNTFRAGRSVKEVSDDYSELNRLKRKAEAIRKQIPLTDEDRTDLELLHKGSITESQLRRRNDNADLLMIVYEAEKPVRAIQRKLKENAEQTHSQYRELAEKYLGDSDRWKEKKSGLRWSIETAERNMEDIAGMSDGGALNDVYFEPIHDHEANNTRMKNDYRDEVRKLNISEKKVFDASKMTNVESQNVRALIEGKAKLSESALVQMYGEELIDTRNLEEVGADVEKIQKAVMTMRSMYEQMFDAANEVLVAHGYEPIAHRENYFPHFTEDQPDTLLAKIGNKLGFRVQKDELPTDIAGLTHTFKPGKKWFGNALERKGVATEYDALEGFDRYVEGIGDVIFHTEDIQKLRALETALRYKYSTKGQQERLDAINNDPKLSEIEKEKKRQDVYDAGMTKHSTFAQWLRRYTDTLAGKKSQTDRNVEYLAGRKTYGVVKALESRVAANMVALNPGSWLTNFIPLVQGTEVKNSNLIKGMAGTVQSLFSDDGFKDMSSFLTNRVGSDTLSSTGVEKVADTLTRPMEWIDQFTSQSLVRAKYMQNIQDGMNSEEAIHDADRFAANVIADRSKGSLPLAFEAKNPLVKILTMYQVEVKNQWSHLFKDIPRTEENVAKVALAYTKFAIGAYIFNDVFEKVVGRRPALDPISWLNDMSGDIFGKKLPNFIDAVGEMLRPEDDDDDETKAERLAALFETETTTGGTALANAGKNIAEDLPFIGGLLGGGRVPIQSALPDLTTIIKDWGNVATGDLPTNKAIADTAKELSNPLVYLVPPVGGGQAKKIYESTKDIVQGGNYSINSKGEKQLRYAVDNTYENWVKGLLFGQYAMEGGTEYVNSGFKGLNAKATEAYDTLRESKDFSNAEAERIIKDVVSESKKEDKINKLKASDIPLPYKRKVAEILDLTQLNGKDVDYANKQPVPKKTESEYKYQEQVDNLAEIGIPTRQAKNLTEKVMQYDNAYSKVMTLIDSGNYSDAACDALKIPKYAHDDKGMKKINLAMENGITPKGYMNRFNAANANHDTSVNQKEAKAYLDGLTMSKADKAMWWTILTGGTDKHNPYK